MKHSKSLNSHTDYLNWIKKSIGASYLGYERQGNTYHIRVIKNGEELKLLAHTAPDNLTPQDYAGLKQQLENHYGSIRKSI